MQCKLWVRDEKEAEESRAMGLDLDAVLTLDDLVKGDNVFFAATGVTDGDFLKGVRYEGRRISYLLYGNALEKRYCAICRVPFIT